MHDPDYNPVVPPHVPLALVHDRNIYDYDTEDPFLAAAALLEKGVPEIVWTRNNGGHWILMGVDAIQELHKDPILFSSRRMMVPDSTNSDTSSFPPTDIDPPLHTAYRAAAAQFFTPQKVDALKSSVRELTKALIGEIKSRGECEFMEDFAAQMPVILFLRLMDLPAADRLKLRSITHRVVNPVDEIHRSVPLDEMSNYLRPVISKRIACPGEDIISRIASHKVDGRPIEFEELVKLIRTVLMGGLDTVAGMLGYFARYLAETPDARRELLGHPEMIGRATEEILRRFPVSNIGRMASRDVVFRGVEMKAGDHLVWPVGMYNFDKGRFPNPMAVQFGRANSRQHATFGIGTHFCIGAVLARAELNIFVEEWLRVIPDFKVKPGATIKYRGGWTVIYDELPLVLSSGAGMAASAA